MQKEIFQEYLCTKDYRVEGDLSLLKELIHTYPWFSSAGILLLLNLKERKDPQYDNMLKRILPNIPDPGFFHRQLGPSAVNLGHPSASVQGNTSQDEQVLVFENNREPGISDTPDSSGKLAVSSVLEDDTLLEFSYKKNEVVDESGKGHSEEIPSENMVISDDSVLPERNFDSWIERLGGSGESNLRTNDKDKIIEGFIKSSPGVIRADKETKLNGDVSAGSNEESESFFTDTLARIYISQGLYNKAIYTYEKLCLKNPEKSIYFASQIEEIKKRYINKQ